MRTTHEQTFIAQSHRLHRMDTLTNEFGNLAFDAGFPELASLLSKFSLQTSKQINALLDQALAKCPVHNLTTAESTCDDEYRVDSRAIAEKLGIEHRALLQTIGKYETKISAFGAVAFEMQPLPNGGIPTRYALLNENQCYLLATLSRNTDRVVDFKVWLVKTFAEHRNTVKPDSQPALQSDNNPPHTVRE